jgi:ribosome-associated translation inhibitor RaiA
MNNSAMRSELLNIYTYLKYLSDTIDNLLDETPTEHMYQVAWLSKCLNLEEVLTIFQNQFINKREKFNLVLQKALKELDTDVDAKIQINSIDKINNCENTKDISIMNRLDQLSFKINTLETNLVNFEHQLQENSKITEHTTKECIAKVEKFERVLYDYLTQTLKSELFDEMNKFKDKIESRQEAVISSMQQAVANAEAVISSMQQAVANAIDELEKRQKKGNKKGDKKSKIEEKSDKKGDIEKKDNETPKSPKWINYIDEAKQKMQEKGWSEHEVAELAKINFNSFRKFQRKDPKLTNGVVNKILKLFDINY